MVYILAVSAPPISSKFGFLCYGGITFQPLFHTLHIVFARYDCRMAVGLRETGAFIVVYPLFEGGYSPKLHIAKNAVQFRYRFLELDDYRLIGCVHCLSSFPCFLFNHLSLSVRHSSNVGFTQENNSPSSLR